MTQLKDLIKPPVDIPATIESKLPAGAPKLSSVLENLRNAIPAGPDIPINAPAGFTLPQPTRVTEFVRSVEDKLPAGMPRVAPVAERVASGGAYRELKAESPTPIASGGFRGISF